MKSCTTSSPSTAIWPSSQARAWSASHKTLVSLLPSLLAVVCLYHVQQLPVVCVYKLIGCLHGAPSASGGMPCAAVPLQSSGQSLTAAAQHVGNTWSASAGQDAHDVLTKACNEVLAIVYYSRPVSIHDCKPCSGCHEDAFTALPYVLSCCNSLRACFSRYEGRPHYIERVVVSS